MSYTRFGPEFAWVQAFERFALGLRVKGQLWNYEDTDAVPEYDHEYFVFAAHAQYSFTETSLLRLNVDKYSRRFSDRPAFDLDGNQLITNPNARYDYLARWPDRPPAHNGQYVVWVFTRTYRSGGPLSWLLRLYAR